MRGSFILKDRTGTPAGYLTQGMQAVRCRLSGAKEGMAAVLFYADGTAREHAVEPSRAEQVWPDEGGGITGVVIARGAEIAADSGEEAKRRFEALRRRADSARKHGREGQPHVPDQPDQPNQIEETPAAQDEATAEPGERSAAPEQGALPERGALPEQGALPERGVLPERRWPPPPCLQSAVYRAGKWEDA